jgi:hypothetical protein
MQKTKIQYLSGLISVEEEHPSTIAELSALIGEAELVGKTVKHYLYYYKYPRVYDTISKLLRDVYPQNEKETSVQHLERYAREGAPALQRLHDLFYTHCPLIPLIPRGIRGHSGKVSQGSLDAATSTFAKGQERVDGMVEMIESMLVGYKIERDISGNVTVEGLARGIQKLNQNLLKQAKEKSKALLS